MTNNAWRHALEALVEGLEEHPEPDEVLESLLSLVRRASGASAALAFLSGYDSQWLCEAVDEAPDAYPTPPGSFATNALGLPFGPIGDAALAVLGSGHTLPCPETSIEERAEINDSANTSPTGTWQQTLGISGQALVVPLLLGSQLEGCLVLWRQENAPFSLEDGEHAMQLAGQAMLAMQLLQGAEATKGRELQEERERIARDLHDLAIQDLFASGMTLERLRDNLRVGTLSTTGRSKLADEVCDALASLEASVRQIRRIVYGLRGEEQYPDLADRLRQEASTSRGNLGFAPTFVVEVDGVDDLDGDIDTRVNEELSNDVVAVVREALSNAARHAHATSVHVSVEVFGTGPSGEVIVGVIDDGAGLDPARTRNSGLANMQRRAVLRGGSFSVGSGPRGRGTSLVWRAPLA